MMNDYDLSAWKPERFGFADVARGKYLQLRFSTAGRPLTELDEARLDNLSVWIQRTTGIEGLA